MAAKRLEDFWLLKFKLEVKASKEATLSDYSGGIHYGILTGLKIASVMVANKLVSDQDVYCILVSNNVTIEQIIAALNNMHASRGVVYETRYILHNFSGKPGKKYYDAGVELGFNYVFDMYQAYIDAGATSEGAKNVVKFRINQLHREVLYS